MKQHALNTGESLAALKFINMYGASAKPYGAAADPGEAVLFAEIDYGMPSKAHPIYSNSSPSELRKNVRYALACYNQRLLDSETPCAERSPNGDGAAHQDAALPNGLGLPSTPISRRVAAKIRKFYAGRVFLANNQPFSKMWVYDASKLTRWSAPGTSYDFPQDTGLVMCFSNSGKNGAHAVFMLRGPPAAPHFLPRCHLLPLTTVRPLLGHAPAKAPEQDAAEFVVTQGISAMALSQFQDRYECMDISREDIFYYAYGLLHAEDCSTFYGKELRRDPPRVPVVSRLSDFEAFAQAGRALAHLHVHYDSVADYPVRVTVKEHPADLTQADIWRVDRMKFGPRGDRTRIVYNRWISLSGIPLDAYDYEINGKPALVWAMEGQGIKEYGTEGLTNDANLWASEVMNDPVYPLKLLRRVITVSLETRKIVRALPFIE